MEKSLKSEKFKTTLKFKVNGVEYVRVDGIWFKYLNDAYMPSKDSTVLEQLYKEKYI